MPKGFEQRDDNWMFGCDICQDVCPWNRFSVPATEPGFKPIPEVLDLSTSEWEKLSEERFRKIFRDSAIKRTKWKGVMRNLEAIRKPGQ